MADKKEKDAFELSDEEFDSMLAGIGAGDQVTGIEVTDETGDTDETDDTTSADTTDDDTGSTDDDTGTTSDDDFDFDNLFDDDTSGGDETGTGSETTGEETGGDTDNAEQMVDLIHKGETIQVPISQAIQLAQKGYDYESKVTKIAPHRRLITLIEEDEELQTKINEHVVNKNLPEFSKREDFGSDDEWLADNINKTVSAVSPAVQIGTESQTQDNQTATGEEAPIVTALRNRDPQNFDKVAPHLVSAAQKLTVEQYSAISRDPQKIVRFYDAVKRQVSTGGTQNDTVATTGKRKTFNLRSGQNPSRSRQPQKKNAWELSNKDFNKLVNKSKGF